MLSGIVLAQPSITASEYNPAIGNTFSGIDVDPALNPPGSSGSGVTWNYASAVSTGTWTFTFISPSSTPGAGSFSGSNLAINNGGGTHVYYTANTSNYTMDGLYTSALNMPYSNKEVLYTYPFTYNSTWSDAFGATYTSSGYPGTRTGTISVVVDGFGTLILPSGTYTNILRVKIDEDIQDDINFGTFMYTTTVDQTTYHWVKENVHNPIYIHATSTTTISGSPTTTSWARILDASFIGTNDQEATNVAFSLFPNPSMGRNIQLVYNAENGTNETNVTVYNTYGQIVLTEKFAVNNGFNNISLDLNGVDAGVYIVEFNDGNGVGSKKLILE